MVADMEKTPNDAAVPDCSDHPVDVLKWCAEQTGRELDPEAEAKLRAICDEPAAGAPMPAVMKQAPTLEDALAGKHGPEIQKIAEESVEGAVNSIADTLGAGKVVGGPIKGFARGGAVVSANADAWRPQDCAPILRGHMFGDRS